MMKPSAMTIWPSLLPLLSLCVVVQGLAANLHRDRVPGPAASALRHPWRNIFGLGRQAPEAAVTVLPCDEEVFLERGQIYAFGKSPRRRGDCTVTFKTHPGGNLVLFCVKSNNGACGLKQSTFAEEGVAPYTYCNDETLFRETQTNELTYTLSVTRRSNKMVDCIFIAQSGSSTTSTTSTSTTSTTTTTVSTLKPFSTPKPLTCDEPYDCSMCGMPNLPPSSDSDQSDENSSDDSSDENSSDDSSEEVGRQLKTPGAKANDPKERIAGSSYLQQPNMYPWMVGLVYNSRIPFCGGVIISRCTILTSVQCVKWVSPEAILVWVAGHNIYSQHNKYMKVSNIHLHSNYNSATKDSDIALITLAEPLKFDTPHIRPICLPKSLTNTYKDTTGTTIGWGSKYLYGPASQYLLQTHIKIMENHVCKYYYWASLTDKMMCAKSYTTQGGFCQGDLGGPFFVEQGSKCVLVGLNSIMNKCGKHGTPTIYSRITAFVNWIKGCVKEDICLY